jgi:O-methyltransferase
MQLPFRLDGRATLRHFSHANAGSSNQDYAIPGLNALHAKGMRGTMRRVFQQYVSECSEPDITFDAMYLDGLFATGTAPSPLRRRDRFRILVQQLERTLSLEGMIAECGCFRGLSSYLLCTRFRRHDARFNGAGYEIYDSFEGLSEPAPQDASSDQVVSQNLFPGHFACSLPEVRRSLADFPMIHYGAGWIPNAFPQDERQYRFVHVDVDLYQPTKASLEFFWPRLVSGGIMVCDDYNWSGAKLAVEELSAAAGAPFTVSASNQAIFAKP